MAIKSLKSIKLPGLPDTYTIPQVDSAPTQGSNNAVSSGGVYEALHNTDTTLTQSGQAADALETGRRVASIRENTKNGFDINYFSANNITIINGVAVGTANAFTTAFKEANGGIQLSCKENTQYTFSGKIKTDGSAGDTGNGFLFRIYYSDTTYSQVVCPNSWTDDYHEFTVISDSGKTIDHISISYVSNGANVWYLTEIQLEEGVSKTYYIPYYTATDFTARNVVDNIEREVESVQDSLSSIEGQIKTRLLWENGTISGSGKNQTSGTAMRTDAIIHVKAGSAIWKTATNVTVTIIRYSHNDLNAYLNTQQILPFAKTDKYVFGEDTYCRFVLQNPNSLSRSHAWADSVVKTDFYDADFINHEIGVFISVLGFSSYLGNGIVLRMPNGVWVGIDSFIGAAYNSVKAIYAGLGVSHFDYFIISHYHLDHVGNIVSLINDGYIDSDTVMILPPDLDTSYDTQIFMDWLNEDGPKAMYQAVRPAITNAGCTVIHPTEGQVISIAGVDIKFFNCDHSVYYPSGNYHSTNYNDLSIGCYVTVGNYNFCDTADIGPIAQQRMVDLNTMFKSNLYTATHHGWDNGTAANYYGLIPAWINRLSPDVVISEDCVALDPRIMTKGAPMQSWCEANGIPNYRSRINGTMYIQLNKYGWKFKGNYSRFIRNNKNWSYSDNSEHVEE